MAWFVEAAGAPPGGRPRPPPPPPRHPPTPGTRSSTQLIQEDDARWFFQQLVIGLDYIHRSGVVNRDIKLENTLLDGSARPLLKICDFGYSKNEMDSRPKTKVGTPGYTGQRGRCRRTQGRSGRGGRPEARRPCRPGTGRHGPARTHRVRPTPPTPRPSPRGGACGGGRALRWTRGRCVVCGRHALHHALLPLPL